MRSTMKCVSLVLAVVTILWSSLRGATAGDDGAEKKPAVVVVRLPADAELIIGGIKSKQSTPVREFDTPPLVPGKKFAYQVKAVWKDGDKEVKRETTIHVSAGETTEINLLETKLSPPSTEKIPAPELMPDMAMEPMPKPKKKPEAEKKPEPEKKPAPKPERIKKPKPKPAPEMKPEPKPAPPPAELTPSVESAKMVEAPAPKGSLELLIPETITLQPGATKLLPIKVIRRHCEGAVSIKFEGVPPGVELKDTIVAAGKQKVYVQAAAPVGAEEKEWEVKVMCISGAICQDGSLKIKIAK